MSISMVVDMGNCEWVRHIIIYRHSCHTGNMSHTAETIVRSLDHSEALPQPRSFNRSLLTLHLRSSSRDQSRTTHTLNSYKTKKKHDATTRSLPPPSPFLLTLRHDSVIPVASENILTVASAWAMLPQPRTGQSTPVIPVPPSVVAALQEVPTILPQLLWRTTTVVTHYIPEPEPPLNLQFRIFHPWKRLLTYLQCQCLGFLDPLSIRVPNPLLMINMRQCIQIHFRKHPKSRIDLRLEWQRQRYIQQVISRPSRIVPQQHV